MAQDTRFTDSWDAVDPFDSGYPHLWVKVEHLGRYLFAARYLTEKNATIVADIGCGTGCGTFELAGIATQVYGVDADNEVLETARKRYARPNASYVQSDLDRHSLSEIMRGTALDAVVCFETLEHLLDPGATLTEFARLVQPGGTLIVSVPNSLSERVNDIGFPSNRYHKRMYSISSIRELLDDSGFTVAEVLGQPLAGEIGRNETRLIRRRQTDARIGDDPAMHSPQTVRRLAMAIGYPEARDVERSYSITIVAYRSLRE